MCVSSGKLKIIFTYSLTDMNVFPARTNQNYLFVECGQCSIDIQVAII